MSTSSEREYRSSTSGLVAGGTTMFAAIMLITVGFLGVLQGIAAISSDTIYAEGLNYSYELDVTVWGWIHLTLGVVGIAVGAGLLFGKVWALTAGVLIAVLRTLGNFAFLPHYPLWSIVLIAFDIFIIWALCQEIDHKV